MNKFYDQYKGLFVEQGKTPYIKQSPANYNSNIPTLSNPYTINKASNIGYHNNQNELRSLFKKYADRQINDSYPVSRKNKPFESVASKEFSDVILPKLKMYDQQIDHRLKKFKTQHQQSSLFTHNNSSNNQNNYSLLQDYNYLINQRSLYEQENSRYKHGYKFKTPSNNIFHKDFSNFGIHKNLQFEKHCPSSQIKQHQIKFQSNNILYPKQSNHHMKTEGNYQKTQSFIEHKLNRSRIKRKSPIFYMKNNPEEDLETEYQRSYSNKKLSLSNVDHHKELMQSSRYVQKPQLKNSNYHEIHKKQKPDPSKQLQKQQCNDIYVSTKNKNVEHENIYSPQMEYLNNEIKQLGKRSNKNQVITEPSSPEHPSEAKYYQSLRQSRKGSQQVKKRQMRQQQSIISLKQEGMKFSQYQNQYAFINKRLQDIYNFNNFYSHKHINSYKLAIINRLQAKRKVQERRNSLKFMLKMEAQENGLDGQFQ